MTTTPEIWEPRDYQVAALEFAAQRNIGGLFMTAGVGKTSISLALLQFLKTHRGVRKVLLVCPLRPMSQVWPSEIHKWIDFQDLRYVIVHGAKKAAALAADADIYLINPEGLKWLQAQPAKLQNQFDVLLIDESTKFKNASSGRFKAMRGWIDRFNYRYILSGTPRPRSIENLWAQVFLLDGGKRLGKFITHFRRKYMVDISPPHVNYPTWVPADGAEEEVYALISDICMTLSDDDYTGAPPFIEDVITIEMPPAGVYAYTQMAEHYLVELERGTIAPKNAAGKSQKLRQISAGFIIDTGADRYEYIHEGKVDALMDLIEQLDGSPLLVVNSFVPEFEMIKRRLLLEGYPAPPYLGGEGGVKPKDTQAVIDAWNSGKCPVIVANPQSAGHGIDGLQQSGNHVCFYNLAHDFELYDQVRRRIRRSGQTKPTILHYIESAGTLDASIRELVSNRQMDQNAFFSALSHHIKGAINGQRNQAQARAQTKGRGRPKARPQPQA